MTPTPFGPQLIGETEKTLNAVLRRFLAGTGLTEPQWVTLRIADLVGDAIDAAGLCAAVAERAHFTDARELVRALTDRGLIRDGRVTSTGRALLADVQASVATETAPVWAGLPAADVAAATRVLNEVVQRARALLN
jgi:hypothetical protein